MIRFFIGVQYTQSTEKMGSSLEVGDRVIWKINKLIECSGVYLQELDSTFSEVKCHYKNGIRCICKLKVSTKILQKDDR